MFQDFTHSKTGILFARYVSLCAPWEGWKLMVVVVVAIFCLDRFALQSASLQGAGFPGPLAVLVSLPSWFVTPLPSGGGLPLPRRLAICSLMVAAVGLKCVNLGDFYPPRTCKLQLSGVIRAESFPFHNKITLLASAHLFLKETRHAWTDSVCSCLNLPFALQFSEPSLSLGLDDCG